MSAERDPLRDWHRLFGSLLEDFFTGTPFEVELERDLSQQQQLLDVVIIRRRPGAMIHSLPDGLEGLKTHNLVTFRSLQEALNPWAIKELIGHYVAYRKLVSERNKLLPEAEFKLYAICARYPQTLLGRVAWNRVQPGVYDCLWGTDEIRVVVANELAKEPRNAALHLFSDSMELVGFGSAAYTIRSATTSRILRQLLRRLEEVSMSITAEEILQEMEAAEIAQMDPEKRQRLLEKLPLEERLRGVSEAEIQRFLEQKRKKSSPRAKRKKSG
jgi:hypothetical protein